MERQKRRSFTKDYKAEVVELCRKSGKSIGAIAKDLGLAEKVVRRWVQQADADGGRGPAGALITAEREDLSSLRWRVKTLEMEREILKSSASKYRRTAPPPIRIPARETRDIDPTTRKQRSVAARDSSSLSAMTMTISCFHVANTTSVPMVESMN